MRRKDREVTDPAKIQDIMERCTCCRVGFNDDGEVYIVPLNFGYKISDDKYTLYFHATGKKDWEFNPMMLKMVAVFKLEVSKLSCKEHA